MGQTTLDELQMIVYDKDSTATAVVLYEHANLYMDKYHNYETRTDYYYRIKIFDKASFDLANSTINLFKEQRVIDIKATTYNLTERGTINQNHLLEKDIFTTKEEKDWTVKKFTLPNLKEGSVIEIKYSLLSPYSNISNWYFQSDIPKIASAYDASIIGNYSYNIKLTGFLKLDKEKPSIHKNCINIGGSSKSGDCLVYSFGMSSIPAFKEEDFMLSKQNYISHISFDLKSYTNTKGFKEKYATTWKQADKSLKEFFFNNQTSKKSFFKNKLPAAILRSKNTLKRAKEIYRFIQQHYTWNEKNWSSEEVKVKPAYYHKSGNVGEINLSLYNSLRAAKMDASLMVLSTRDHRVPTKLFPVIFDYNYVIIKVHIEGKDYYLDATNKFLPFGQLPIRALNGEARIINPKAESTWEVLKPQFKSSKNTTATLKLSNDGRIKGSLVLSKHGYYASTQRSLISLKKEAVYLEDFENENPEITIEKYEIIDKDKLDTPLKENFTINIAMDDNSNKIMRINPIFFDRITENPFKLKERKYPVDFAFSRKNNYYLNLEIPPNYKIVKLPENRVISLPNNGGRFIIRAEKKGNTISVYLRLNIAKSHYSVTEYYALKDFYTQIINSESGYIILEKN